MADRVQGADAAALARLNANIERWRQTRTKLSGMPEPLWREAVAVSGRVGVSVVAKACGLNATRLNARAVLERGAMPRVAPTRFLELDVAKVLTASPTSAGDGIVIELVDAQAGRMSIRLPTSASGEVARWVEAFRRTSR